MNIGYKLAFSLLAGTLTFEGLSYLATPKQEIVVMSEDVVRYREASNNVDICRTQLSLDSEHRPPEFKRYSTESLADCIRKGREVMTSLEARESFLRELGEVEARLERARRDYKTNESTRLFISDLSFFIGAAGLVSLIGGIHQSLIEKREKNRCMV